MATKDPASLVLVVGGGADVGKTSVLRRFLEDRFIMGCAPTKGLTFTTAPLPPLAGETAAELIICDPSHSVGVGWPERLRRAIPPTVSAFGMALVIDPQRPETLLQADEWLLQARAAGLCGAGPEHVVLLAHKHDAITEASDGGRLDASHLDAYCTDRGLLGWSHTTASSGRSVHAALERLLESMALGALGSARRRPMSPPRVGAARSDDDAASASSALRSRMLAVEGGGGWPPPVRAAAEGLQAELRRRLSSDAEESPAERGWLDERVVWEWEEISRLRQMLAER